MVRTPNLPLTVNGAGDAIAALFFAYYLLGGKIGAALSRATSSTFGILAKTAQAGTRERETGRPASHDGDIESHDRPPGSRTNHLQTIYTSGT